jgi:hypothetical protein
VTASLGYWATEVGHWVAGVLGFVGFAAILGAAQWAWRRRAKRKATAKRAADAQTAPPPSIDAEAADPASTAPTPDDR